MDRFDTLLLFTRIVEAGSFSKAAVMLEIPRATATHAIKELEARLSTRLLERTTRHVRTTPDGQAFYERCVHVLNELEDAEASLQHVAANPRGWVSVNDSENYVVCALRAAGLIQLPRFHVEEELDDGRLVEVLRDWPSPGMPVSAMYPFGRQLSPRVRVFVDWIAGLYEARFGAPDRLATGASAQHQMMPR